MTKIATCKYWVASRQRFCKFQISKTSTEFCAVHDVGSGDNVRIPCPLDPKHMIFKKDTEKHLRKCSKVVDEIFSRGQPLTRKGCNAVPRTISPKGDDVESVAFSENELDTLRINLVEARAELIRLIITRSESAVIPAEEGNFELKWSEEVESCASAMLGKNWECRSEIDKHNLQNASLLEVLNRLNLAPTASAERLYVELGCGKAGLSKWLMYCVDASPSVAPVFLLLDYEARRHKQENKKEIQDKVPPSNVIRLRSDIRDVDLAEFLTSKDSNDIPDIHGKLGSPEFRLSELIRKVAVIQSRPSWPFKEVVGIAKHLCGVATDYGLRCLQSISNRRVSVVFATCCHHRCLWDELVGREILEALKICSSSSEFARLISLAGWATSEGLTEDKRTIGRLVKSVIDLSRVHWIVNNFVHIGHVEYAKYIQDNITPENFCIALTGNDT